MLDEGIEKMLWEFNFQTMSVQEQEQIEERAQLLLEQNGYQDISTYMVKKTLHAMVENLAYALGDVLDVLETLTEGVVVFYHPFAR